MTNSNTQIALNSLLLSIRSRRRLIEVFHNDVKWEIALFVIEAHLMNKSIDLSGLSHLIGKARNTITLQIETMVEEGYLTSIKDAQDLRRKTIVPTTALLEEFELLARAITPEIAKASYKLQTP